MIRNGTKFALQFEIEAPKAEQGAMTCYDREEFLCVVCKGSK